MSLIYTFVLYFSLVRPWVAGFPKPNSPLDQFIYMKVDLEKRRATGLAHSVGSVERFVACMLPAKNLVEAENQRLIRVSEDSLYHPPPKPKLVHPQRQSRKFRRRRRLEGRKSSVGQQSTDGFDADGRQKKKSHDSSTFLQTQPAR